ncbi:MAG TPA: ATP-binding protein [Marmoricola sp.]|nr:ATP-binding protein [Marmoricola sp.]
MSELTGTSREVLALRNLHDLITTVHAVQDLEEVLNTTAQGVVDVLGFQVAVINIVDPYGFVEAVAVAGDEDAVRTLKSRRMPLAQFIEEFEIADEWGMLRFVPHDRLPDDAESSWIPDLEPLDLPDAWHPLDALYCPLRGPTGELVGVLSVDLPVDRMRPGALSRQVLEMYAVQAGLAIHHATERERLRERIRLAGATRRIVETASRELDLGKIVDTAFRPLVDGFRCDRVLIRVFDAEHDGAHGHELARGGATYPPDLVQRARPRIAAATDATDVNDRMLEVGERIARTCWSQHRTCVIDPLVDTSAGLVDTGERALVDLLLSSLDGDTLVIVPLGAGIHCLGYLTFVRAAPVTGWTQAEDEAALVVGREIGRAVDRARLYQRERLLVAELQELDRYKGEMIATITHELKNPLTSIGGHVELLQDEEVAPESVEAIARNVGRLQTLVEDMLLLTKVNDPRRPFLPNRVDLSALIEETRDLLAIQAARGGLTLDARAVRRDVVVEGERDDLARLLANVVGNAVKYTPSGGRIDLELELEETGATGRPHAVFTCTDTGIGIAEHDLVTLFDEFDRSSNPVAHRVPGTGIGLAIVRRIVDRHRGSIGVESKPGEGSTFRVRLPLGSGPR